GTKLGCAVIPATAGAGWKEGMLLDPMNCTMPISYAVTANTTYIVSYGVNGHYYKDPCTPAYPFTNSLANGNYSFSITATGGLYASNLIKGSFPNAVACSNTFADVKFYTGTQ